MIHNSKILQDKKMYKTEQIQSNTGPAQKQKYKIKMNLKSR